MKKAQLGFRSNAQVNFDKSKIDELFKIAQVYMKNNSFDYEEYSTEFYEFGRWFTNEFSSWVEKNQAGDQGPDMFFILEFDNDVDCITSILDWLKKLYTRGFCLVYILYFLRMTEREGIFKTILSAKKKFILALLFWPVFIFKYPANVVKVFVVEAEVRRFGSLFRKLSKEERRFIEDFASEGRFLHRLKLFHIQNAGLFDRTLLVAIVATLLINLSGFSCTQADDSISIRAGPSIEVQIANDFGDFDSLSLPGYCKKFFLVDNLLKINIPVLLLAPIRFMIKAIRVLDVYYRIEHIPLKEF